MHRLTLSLALTATLAVVPSAAWLGSSVAPSAAAPYGAPAVVTPQADPAPVTPRTSTRSGVMLPIGVRLPDDAALVGAPRTARYTGSHGDWRAEVRLPRTSASAALDWVEHSLAAQGWRIERGSTDVFAVRRSGDRWQLIQVIVESPASNDAHGSVLDIGIGSRLA